MLKSNPTFAMDRRTLQRQIFSRFLVLTDSTPKWACNLLRQRVTVTERDKLHASACQYNPLICTVICNLKNYKLQDTVICIKLQSGLLVLRNLLLDPKLPLGHICRSFVVVSTLCDCKYGL